MTDFFLVKKAIQKYTVAVGITIVEVGVNFTPLVIFDPPQSIGNAMFLNVIHSAIFTKILYKNYLQKTLRNCIYF